MSVSEFLTLVLDECKSVRGIGPADIYMPADVWQGLAAPGFHGSTMTYWHSTGVYDVSLDYRLLNGQVQLVYIDGSEQKFNYAYYENFPYTMSFIFGVSPVVSGGQIPTQQNPWASSVATFQNWTVDEDPFMVIEDKSEYHLCKFEEYHGFSRSYKFCTICDKKKTLDDEDLPY